MAIVERAYGAVEVHTLDLVAAAVVVAGIVPDALIAAAAAAVAADLGDGDRAGGIVIGAVVPAAKEEEEEEAVAEVVDAAAVPVSFVHRSHDLLGTCRTELGRQLWTRPRAYRTDERADID